MCAVVALAGSLPDKAPRGLLDKLLVVAAKWDILPALDSGHFRFHHCQSGSHQRSFPDCEAGHCSGLLSPLHCYPHQQKGSFLLQTNSLSMLSCAWMVRYIEKSAK